MLNSDMHAGYIKENNACKKLRLILNQKQSTVSFTTSFLFLFYSLTNFG